MHKIKKSIFFKAKDKKLAAKVSIKSPTCFKNSIDRLKKYGLTKKEKGALVLAQNRARAQLQRKNLSLKERKEFRKIASMKLPRVG